MQAPCMIADSLEIHLVVLRSTLFPARFKNIAVVGELPELLVGLLNLRQGLRIYIFMCHEFEFHAVAFER